jgi:hypothetical protein
MVDRGLLQVAGQHGTGPHVLQYLTYRLNASKRQVGLAAWPRGWGPSGCAVGGCGPVARGLLWWLGAGCCHPRGEEPAPPLPLPLPCPAAQVLERLALLRGEVVPEDWGSTAAGSGRQRALFEALACRRCKELNCELHGGWLERRSVLPRGAEWAPGPARLQGRAVLPGGPKPL